MHCSGDASGGICPLSRLVGVDVEKVVVDVAHDGRGNSDPVCDDGSCDVKHASVDLDGRRGRFAESCDCER